ncbi:MAG: hypothetical protein IJ795_04430 [Bacteroidales bacterium]|nr:hypothetical protein [Bacteroidales bacterium]
MGKIKSIFLIALSLLPLVLSCNGIGRKEPQKEPKRVMIMLSAGFNNLSGWLLTDIGDIKAGYLPPKNSEEIMILVAKHSHGAYTTQTSPAVIRLYRDAAGIAVSDTLLTLPKGEKLADAKTLRTCLEFVQKTFPAEHFGMVLSSHATGWMPAGYYANPSNYEKVSSDDDILWSARRTAPRRLSSFEYDEPEVALTKSVLQETFYEGVTKMSTEVEIEAFAAAIPMHLDYLLFDACLMGCVEVAYSLRGVADKVGFSQTEVMSEGFDYDTIVERLLHSEVPNPELVCSDYIAMYETFTGASASATISIVDTRRMDDLARVCKSLFDKYREEIASLDWKTVQCFGGSKHWFFDLRDILDKAGMDEEDAALLDGALENCMLYKGTTGQYYSDTDKKVHKVDAFCGFSMYLPCAGSGVLDAFYSQLDWNKDTKLINNL